MAIHRNKFFSLTAAAVMLAAALAGCGGAKQAETTADHSADHSTTTASSTTGGMSWQEMDKAHAESMKAFPAKTEGKGNQMLEPVMEGNTKVFNLTVSKIKWEVAPGQKVDAYAYNGMIPGPTLRVTEGDHVKINLKNEMTDESTALHLHGLLLPNEMDGVSFLTQTPITPGSSFTYEFDAPNAGSEFYHSHHNSTTQQTRGLYGALIIDPKGHDTKKTVYGETQDIPIMVGDGMLGFTINGKQFPATEPIVAKVGEKVRMRFYNAGQTPHPMHLHGLTMNVVEKDGYPLASPYKADTILVGPGERYDVIVESTNPGTWAFHCHILGHAENEHGMFGMVTAFIVK
ncbi:MAG TPA: copper oxidase [Symbiobacteriaceae bacterium]|nr:copper oxidase [Symbiobacteriaceae bacterium]